MYKAGAASVLSGAGALRQINPSQYVLTLDGNAPTTLTVTNSSNQSGIQASSFNDTRNFHAGEVLLLCSNYRMYAAVAAAFTDTAKRADRLENPGELIGQKFKEIGCSGHEEDIDVREDGVYILEGRQWEEDWSPEEFNAIFSPNGLPTRWGTAYGTAYRVVDSRQTRYYAVIRVVRSQSPNIFIWVPSN